MQHLLNIVRLLIIVLRCFISAVSVSSKFVCVCVCCDLFFTLGIFLRCMVSLRSLLIVKRGSLAGCLETLRVWVGLVCGLHL